MLGAALLILHGASAPQTYDGLVDAFGPISHWPLMGLTDRKGVSGITSFGSHETGLPPIAQLDISGSARGFNGSDAYGTILHDAAYQVSAGGVFVLMQPDQAVTKMQVLNSGVGAAGSMALEVAANGQPRAYRHRSDGTIVVVAGSAGQIVAGTSYLYGVTWGPNGLRLWLLDEDLQPGLVASDPETDWATVTDTATKYLGRWSGSAIDHFNGVLGHLQFYGAELSLTQIETLARPQLVVWLDDIDAGSVEASGSTTIDLALHAHPETGFAPAIVSQGSLGTASVNAEDVDYDAGSTTGDDDAFTAKITAGGVDSRTATVTIDVEAASGQTGLTRPTLAFSAGQDAVPGSNVVYVAPGGSGDGTIGSPYGSLAAAHNHGALGAGWTIVCRGGVYDHSSTFTPTKNGSAGSPITVMAYPGETPIFDGNYDLRGFLTPNTGKWESVDGSLDIWRSVATFSSPGSVRGYWVELGEHWALWDHRSDTDHTATGASYRGPSVRLHSDGRLYIRFQRPSPLAIGNKDWPAWQTGCNGQNFVLPDTENPNNYPIGLFRKNGEYAMNLSGRSHWIFKDINFRDFDRIVFLDSQASNINFFCGRWHGFRFGIFTASGSNINTWNWQGTQFSHGRLDAFSHDFVKSDSASDFFQFNSVIHNQSGGGNSWTFEDCFFYGLWQLIDGGNTPPSNFIFRHNWCDYAGKDDFHQKLPGWNNCEIAYNVFHESAFWGYTWGSQAGVTAPFIHHNIATAIEAEAFITGESPQTKGINVQHGGSGRQSCPNKVYNNTIVIGSSPNVEAPMDMTHAVHEVDNSQGTAHEVYNNVLGILAETLREGHSFGGTSDFVQKGWALSGSSNEIYDYNHWFRIVEYGAFNNGNMFGPFYDRHVQPSGVGDTYFFDRLSNLQASGANVADHELNGTDEEASSVADCFAASPFVDVLGLDFRVKTGHTARTGAKDLSATGWPGASGITANSYRGAVDPTTGKGPDGFKPGPRL